MQGDEVVVTGQKIWTSFAQHAQWCILVVRSDPASQRHRGLSFLLVDMKTPASRSGRCARLTGEAWFNEVFFDAVRVPLANLVGTLHHGWDVVVTTLAHERGSSAGFARLRATLVELCALARRTPSATGQGNAASDPRIRDRLAQYWTEIASLRMTASRAASALEAGGVPGPEGSTLKLAWSELEQRVIRHRDRDRRPPRPRRRRRPHRTRRRLLEPRTALVARHHDLRGHLRGPAQHPGAAGTGPAALALSGQKPRKSWTAYQRPSLPRAAPTPT